MPTSSRRPDPRALLAASLSILMGAALAPVAGAAEPYLVNRAAAAQGDASAEHPYWTRERMESAQPMPMPEPEPADVLDGDLPDEAVTSEPSAGSGGPGAPPSVVVPAEPGAGEEGSLDEDESASDDPLDDGITPEPGGVPPASRATEVPTSVGTDGCHFSSSRLNPRTIDVKYPYSAVGKLFFTQPGIGDFVCSGAVLRPRVVVTAGHCVHSGNGQQSGFFTNFLFCPAYRGGPSAKYGCWNWAFLTVTTDWFTSGNVFPNAADYAMFEMFDRSIGGATRRIADLTGFFGYQTSALSANHVHMLGYPAAFSGGARMHQVASGRCYAGGSNTERYGSDMRGGSSGGPWVQDFGRVANGQTVTNPNGPNLIVGITSYSNVSTAPKYQGSSIPDSRFESLLTTVCNRDTTAPANCF